MNDQPKQDINNEVVEEAVVEALVEQQTTEQVLEDKPVLEEVSSKKTIKDYLSKDLFAGIKVISGKEDQVEVEKLTDNILEEYESTFNDISENQIISAKVIGISDNDVMVDIGFKSEGLISRSEFNNKDLPEIGSNIDIFLEKFEDTDGNITLSKYKADFIKRWDELKDFCEKAEPVQGKIIKRVKGGLVVDLGVIQAFLPGSQADIQPIKNFDDLINKEFDFQIVKVDELRKNLVVSRKAILEESLNEKRQELMTRIKVGAQLQGLVKNITDFGAFVDLGGVDGLIHITDFSWGRINHPSEIVSIGDEITVQIIDYNQETSRISLGLKQLVENPWKTIPNKYSVGDIMTGKIVSIMNYGIFIELEKGIEGLIHISEISWTKNIQNLPDQYKVGDSLESKILFIDANEQKISLGIKQLTQDPWNDISSQVSIGDKKEGAVNKVTKFGAYVDLGKDIEGFIRNTDFHWTKNPLHPKEFVNEGDKIKFVVVDISDKDRKILLSMKDLAENPWSDIVEKYSAGDKLKGTVSVINDAGIVVDMGDDIVGLVPSDQISKELKKDYLPSIEPGGTIDLLVVEVKEKDKNVILMLDQPDAD
ncbi:MAG TPA: 30S ribosomal protein S1 [Candidatus Marinimicrobia bacterium]|nr:30S ribosomal protein S1 [Candidatus Neomarinimicrobiota bacterium]HIL86664.1 30S ribosomal protein S1 [Candidatus Neomarinimicrobiota bacterium]